MFPAVVCVLVNFLVISFLHSFWCSLFLKLNAYPVSPMYVLLHDMHGISYMASHFWSGAILYLGCISSWRRLLNGFTTLWMRWFTCLLCAIWFLSFIFCDLLFSLVWWPMQYIGRVKVHAVRVLPPSVWLFLQLRWWLVPIVFWQLTVCALNDPPKRYWSVYVIFLYTVILMLPSTLSKNAFVRLVSSCVNSILSVGSSALLMFLPLLQLQPSHHHLSHVFRIQCSRFEFFNNKQNVAVNLNFVLNYTQSFFHLVIYD